MTEAPHRRPARSLILVGSVAAPLALWLSQPPLGLWPLAFIAILPWIQLSSDFAAQSTRPTRQDYGIIWLSSVGYWLISLQGLRLAHPLMFIPWLLFAGYLAAYHVAFVAMLRRCIHRNIPLLISVPIVWVGLECIRNYLLTGISVLMLGHHVVDVPALIQIADLFGTYGVSFLIAMSNAALWLIAMAIRERRNWRPMIAGVSITAASLLATFTYGNYRIRQPVGPDLARFALIQRDEPVEYDQTREREIEIFRNYMRETIAAVRSSEQPIDAVVWPESMFTASEPWYFADPELTVPETFEGTEAEFRNLIRIRQEYFTERVRYLQNGMAAARPHSTVPRILAGCAIVRYAHQPLAYSGLVNIDPDGTLTDWYGKTHLVMFGEYIPIAPAIPGLRSLVPPGMGLETGTGAVPMQINDTVVAPNICIETAVERVMVNQLGQFPDPRIPDVIVTVTNDGWFDDSSVIDHHLVCARLVAVGCRRPILSAANSGPTAWIDSTGGVVERLPTGANGVVIASPQQDQRVSVYLRIGDWPARICAIAMVGMMIGFKIKGTARTD